ncbi:hypothetical protein [Aliirhizobium smilacinae]|uniref:Uncharacterized protein n=1 Tax=Aliirhizobium smilacinae TaxID=1395944 RepID=A0A5C4XRW3_9HYPH|nr:hypothetical protein [Rhizobium smilacinae]TNM65334.1 hypothetical protein FHP24_03400 [Rhizobium smilacinae]
MELRREKHVSAFTTEDEMAAIIVASKRHNMTISGFVRSAVCECAEIRPFFTEDDRLIIKHLRAELKCEGLNLTSMLIALNRGDRSDLNDIKNSILAMERTIAGLCMELLQRTDPPRNYRRSREHG